MLGGTVTITGVVEVVDVVVGGTTTTTDDPAAVTVTVTADPAGPTTVLVTVTVVGTSTVVGCTTTTDPPLVTVELAPRFGGSPCTPRHAPNAAWHPAPQYSRDEPQ